MSLRYFLFYKPFQVLTQFSPEGEKITLAHYFKNIPKDIYPVGRLDFDSEGLLVLTNDKKLTANLLEPKHQHLRTYWVQVEGVADELCSQKLCAGVPINVSGKTHQAIAAACHILQPEPTLPERNPPIRFRKNSPTSWLSISLTEGKNRQVRKMTAAIGLPTLRLVRYSIGAVTIQQMQPADIIEVKDTIIAQLLKQTKA